MCGLVRLHSLAELAVAHQFKADTIDGNCQPAKNLKMWPPVCVCVSSSSLYAHPSSGRESRRVLLYGLVAVVRVDSHLENDSIQVSAVFPANTCLNCVRSPSDSFSMTVSSR